jgi:hypothetical protein
MGGDLDLVAVVTHASSSTHGIGCFNTLQQTFGPSRAEHQNIAHSFLDSTSTPSLLQNQLRGYWGLSISTCLPDCDAILLQRAYFVYTVINHKSHHHHLHHHRLLPSISVPKILIRACVTIGIRDCVEVGTISVPHPKMTPAVKYGQIIEYIPGKLSKTPIFPTSCAGL